MKYLLATIFVWFCGISVSVQSDDFEKISSKYGPSRTDFIAMCEKPLSSNDSKIIEKSTCFIYFMGMRNGYLKGTDSTMFRASVYHVLGGNIEPAGELSMKYLGEFSSITRKNGNLLADDKLFQHATLCVNREEPVELLKEFLEYSKHRRKKWGAQVVFDEFVVKNYAGKCMQNIFDFSLTLHFQSVEHCELVNIVIKEASKLYEIKKDPLEVTRALQHAFAFYSSMPWRDTQIELRS